MRKQPRTEYRHEALGVTHTEWAAASRWFANYCRRKVANHQPIDVVDLAISINGQFKANVATCLLIDLSTHVQNMIQAFTAARRADGLPSVRHAIDRDLINAPTCDQ